jgi:hypothetical protein
VVVVVEQVAHQIQVEQAVQVVVGQVVVQITAAFLLRVAQTQEVAVVVLQTLSKVFKHQVGQAVQVL